VINGIEELADVPAPKEAISILCQKILCVFNRCQQCQRASTLRSMNTLPIINRTYDLYKQIVDITEHLTKRWRFTLGQSIEDTVLHLLSELIMAKNAPKPLKAGYLIRACSHQETCMLKLRLCLELKLVNETKIFQTQATVEEVGRQIGGWLKSVQSQ